MKTVTQAAEFRRSIRNYSSEPIPQSELAEILRVAGLAPSPWNLQPWRVHVVTDPALKAELRAASYGQPQVEAGAAVFVIWSDMSDTLAKVEDTIHPGMSDRAAEQAKSMRDIFAGMGEENAEKWAFAEANIFLGFLLLAIAERGYGSSAMLGFEPDKVRALLGLPDHAQIPALVAVGKPDEEGFPHHRHGLDRFVTWR